MKLALLMGGNTYIPHGHCYLWQPSLIALHAVSDGLIAIAYLSIPITLVWFVRQRRDIPFPSVFWLFSGFIISCGLTHLVQIWTLWHPDYWLSGACKALTAWISIATAIYLVPLLSQALTLPNINEVRSLVQTLWQEIGEREKVEASLRRYERIISTAQDGIFLLDAQGIYQIANETYLHWHQKQPDELIGQPITAVLNDDTYRQKIEPYFDRCLAGESQRIELWVEYPELGKQFMSIGFTPFQEPDAASQTADEIVAGVIVTMRNLTDLKQAEMARQESELRFRGIFDQMYQLIGLLAPTGILLEANHAALDFAGVTIDEVRGKPFWDAVWWSLSPATQARLREAIARAAAGEFIRYEAEVQGVGGQVITIDFSLRPVFDETGKVVLLIPEGRDISDRIKAEKELQLQAVVTRNMAEGICLVRTDNGIIVYANPKFESMFGYDPGELNGQHVSIVNHPTTDMTPEDINQAIRTAVLTDQEATYEVYNVKKDGTPFWCEATTSVFDHPDYGPVLVAVQQDISDRKAAQSTIQASLKEKELLLKEIYHRVKNNLQVIYSLLSLQSRNLSDSHAKTAILDSQNRVKAMSLVHEKLYQSNDLAHIDLDDYVRSLAYSLLETYLAQANSIQLDIDIDACSLDIERAIPCGLILTELIANALKYAFPKGRQGTITIQSINWQPQQTTLVIKDDGVGMPAIVPAQTTSSLGLNLVHNLAKQIKGSIEIKPTHIGAEFWLSFPQLG